MRSVPGAFTSLGGTDRQWRVTPSHSSGLPWWLNGKESTCNAGDVGSIPGSGKFPGGGNRNPLQYSCWANPMDRGACGLQSMGS